jgi:outer membrane protein assembly factor BamB
MNKAEQISIARRVAWIAAIFSLLVSLLMLLNFIQIKSHKPLESDTLAILVQRLSAEPDSHALMTEIRQMDMLARKAYFSSLWQIRTGGILLLIGTIVLVLALRIYNSLRFSIDRPSETAEDRFMNRILAQRWVVVSGIVILILGAASAFFTDDFLRLYEVEKAAKEPVTAKAEIEEITITTVEDTIDSIEADTINETDANSPEEEVTEKTINLTPQQIRGNHNSFRGPWGNAAISHKGIPTDWDGASGKNILWKTAIPVHGYNSPVIWEDHIFITGASTSKRVVYAINRRTGKIMWEREVKGIPGSPATPPKTTDDTGLAAPTVTTDGQRVFAIFGTGDIISFDFEGNQLWARNLGVPKNHYGHSSSLLTWDNKVLVQYDTQGGSKVLALDAGTGATVWETRRTSDVSWASPILAEVQGKQRLILLGNPDLAAYDIETGKQLWTVNCMSGEVGPSPSFGSGKIFAANEYANMLAVDATTGRQIWESRHYLPEVASPVYHDGLLYIATTFAVVAAFDANTGDLVWEYDADDQFYSSPVIADGKLYIFDTSGKAYIFKPGRKAELIASPTMGEAVYSNPAFAAQRMYVRTKNHLYCIGQK